MYFQSPLLKAAMAGPPVRSQVGWKMLYSTSFLGPGMAGSLAGGCQDTPLAPDLMASHWFKPSRSPSEGERPAAARRVGNLVARGVWRPGGTHQSVTWMMEVSSEPGSILPGAVRLATVRVPPSHRVYLPPRRGALLAGTGLASRNSQELSNLFMNIGKLHILVFGCFEEKNYEYVIIAVFQKQKIVFIWSSQS